MLFILNLRLEVIPRSPANCEIENYLSVGSRVGCTFCLVESAVFVSGSAERRLTSGFLAREDWSGETPSSRRHHSSCSLWLGRVYRLARRRIYDYRCWLFFLSGLDRGGKRGIEHGQSNGFGENGDCTG